MGIKVGIRVMLLSLALALLAACSDRATASVEGFRTSNDGRTLELALVLGQGDTDVRARIVEESADEVVVEATYRMAGGTRPSIGIPTMASVELTDPLGSRTVRTEDGQAAVPPCRLLEEPYPPAACVPMAAPRSS